MIKNATCWNIIRKTDQHIILLKGMHWVTVTAAGCRLWWINPRKPTIANSTYMTSNQYVTTILVVSPLGFSHILFKIYFEINHNRWVSESFPNTNCCMIRERGGKIQHWSTVCSNMQFITEIDYNYCVSLLTWTPGNHGNLVLLQSSNESYLADISITYPIEVRDRDLLQPNVLSNCSSNYEMRWNLDSAYLKTLHPSVNIDIVY